MDAKRKQEIIGMALSYFRANLDEAREAMDGPDVDFPCEEEVADLTKAYGK
jgi:hypothetical protein